jgi:hypothetical protein
MENIPQIPGQTLLYKYRSLDTQQQMEFVRDILVNHRLYCATAASLNDPFECRVQVSFAAPSEVKIQKAVARILEERPGISLAEAHRMAPARCTELERNGPKNLESLILGELGIVSLAGTLDSLLMWSHYGGGHAGLCIEFCASTASHADFFGRAHLVTYQEDLPVVHVYTDHPLTKVKKYLLTKAVDWSYERESRIIVQNRKATQYYDFDPVLIRRVLLGSRMSTDRVESIRSFVNEIRGRVRPTLWRGAQSRSVYGLDFRQIE